MRPGLRLELVRLAVGAVVLLGVGALVGRVLPVLLAGSLAYIVWHLVQIRRVETWLDRRQQGPPPRVHGAWVDLLADVTGLRRKSRKRKRRARKIIARFRQAAQAMPDAALILREDGDLEWFNRAAISTLGLRFPQDLGRPIGNLVRQPGFADYVASRHYEIPFELPSPIDESRRLLVRIAPYGSDRRLLLVRDITRLHRLEQMRRDFVANVSHELRSPLTVVIGYLEMLGDAQPPPEWRKPLQEMETQAQRMRLIVEDLLRLSELEHSAREASHQPIDVAELIERVRADAVTLSGGAHEVRAEVAPGLSLLGDRAEIYSALANLAFNAVRYTPAGGRVTLRWRCDAGGGHLEVEDTGIGIEAHHIPRLTERFYRVDKARSRQVGGTGLGLAIVKHVLARHGATLRVTSAPGEGSTFTCDFPSDRIGTVSVPAPTA